MLRQMSRVAAQAVAPPGKQWHKHWHLTANWHNQWHFRQTVAQPVALPANSGICRDC